MENKTNDLEEDKKKQPWIKRLGWAAFLFFLIKGIVWLFVFFGLFKMCN